MQAAGDYVKAIVGPARSGTTWIGTVINSHPDVVYRFEPFNRLRHCDSKISELSYALKSGKITESQAIEIHTALLKAHPLSDKPPFFNQKSYPLFSVGKNKAWVLSRLLSSFSGLYKVAYSPRKLVPVIFKEVTFVEQFNALLKNTSVPVVYVVRHPCATVLSDFKGQIKQKMPTGRQTVLKTLLKRHSPDLFEQYKNRLEKLTQIEKTALLWRIEVESCVSAAKHSSQGLVISYERFAEDAYTYANQIFEHFGLDFAQETGQFLDRIYSINSPADIPHRSREWGNKFFTIYRNPKTQKDAWKATISSEDRKKIEAIVTDSEVFDFCAALSGWT